MGCRYVIGGAIATIGIKAQRVDGEPLKDMRMILLTTSEDKLRSYFETHG